MKKRVYLAGRMRGVPEFNFPAFHAGAATLRARGYEVFNPAEHDAAQYGEGFEKENDTGDETLAWRQCGFSLRRVLASDLAWICAEADAVALLPGWEQSLGASAERATAVALGLEIIEL